VKPNIVSKFSWRSNHWTLGAADDMYGDLRKLAEALKQSLWSSPEPWLSFIVFTKWLSAIGGYLNNSHSILFQKKFVGSVTEKAWQRVDAI
jgi:hypothetical protein